MGWDVSVKEEKGEGKRLGGGGTLLFCTKCWVASFPGIMECSTRPGSKDWCWDTLHTNSPSCGK